MPSFFNGWIKSDKVGNWWRDALTAKERGEIEKAFEPLGEISAESLLQSNNPVSLGSLAGHLKKENVRHLGYKVLARADALVNEENSLIDLHFYYAARGEFFYRWRDHDQFAMEEAVNSFRRQIELGPRVARLFLESKSWGFVPAHAGYRQLRIIEEKRGNFTVAMALCEQAKAEGWADDWDQHILRIERKLRAISERL